jgi:hypothetical protein
VGGSCVAAKTCSGDTCAGSPSFPCGTTVGCDCYKTTEGANLCLTQGGNVSCGECTSSSDCPPGSFCAKGPGCCGGQGFCAAAGPCLT